MSKKILKEFLSRADVIVLTNEDLTKFSLTKNIEQSSILTLAEDWTVQVFPEYLRKKNQLERQDDEIVCQYLNISINMNKEDILDCFLDYFNAYTLKKYNGNISFKDEDVSIVMQYAGKSICFVEYCFGIPAVAIGMIMSQACSFEYQNMLKDICFEKKVKYPDLFKEIQYFRKYWYASDLETKNVYVELSN